MIRKAIAIGIVAAALFVNHGPVLAQSHGQHAQHGQAGSPYVEFMVRTIKAMSESQVADLRAGRGMGLALAAELNSYPGPKHVLELAVQLNINDERRKQLADMSAEMTTETAALGEQIIALEAELDRLFAHRTVTLASLESTTQAIGLRQASLRAAHLKYHLTTRGMLTSEQTLMYDRLRGYVGSGAAPTQKP